MTFDLDMIQTAGVGALALVLGALLTRKVDWLRRFCIPSPVSGGLIISLISLLIYLFADLEIRFDTSLKDFFMIAFFTCVGFQCDLSTIKQGGKTLLVMILLLVVMIFLQNSMPLLVTKLMGVNPLVSLASGSISMVGGHGTAGGFSAILESKGLVGGGTVAMAAATFGLLGGSLLGGPLSDLLIRTKLGTLPNVRMQHPQALRNAGDIGASGLEPLQHSHAVILIILVMALGTLVSRLLALTDVTFPTYFGALLSAVAVRNLFSLLSENGRFRDIGRYMEIDKITEIGNVCLMLFLGMAMISLKLWELSTLALPLFVILALQVVMMGLFCYFISFPLLGGDYDAAVLVAGFSGFGLGATPNAIANMNAVCRKYHYTVKPFLIVPIVGTVFVDLINTTIITFFLNAV